MSYSIDYSAEVQKIIKKWKKSNPDAFKKLYKILPELEQHPRTGTGHPEALKGGNDITWSRRVTAHDRIIYDIYDDVVTVLIVEVEGHYNDK
ncbi:Txe/YoeB family addiction module toxin [Prevotella sp. E9-3]|uniref:Txe/YoeB family addiction module toxin n=1 Tax=Prevotella sp. E9-3 TaxID=2913621 RepID=UPI001EDBE41B|nr:Txe/YoeB family addiction module toxin [Prevotella sp. E9-3]UKK47684.1 Txe/YoeB family addiction module toxin [Prevotella sp. E9-3]